MAIGFHSVKPVTIITTGPLDVTGASLTVGPYYATANGVLTAIRPTSGVLHVVGYAGG